MKSLIITNSIRLILLSLLLIALFDEVGVWTFVFICLVAGKIFLDDLLKDLTKYNDHLIDESAQEFRNQLYKDKPGSI